MNANETRITVHRARADSHGIGSITHTGDQYSSMRSDALAHLNPKVYGYVMGSVKKREWTTPSGKRRKAFRARYEDQDGIQRQKTFKYESDAVAWLESIAPEIGAGVHVPERETITVGKALDVWLTACEVGREGRKPVERSTIESYRNHAANYLRPRLGTKLLTELNKPRIAALRDDLLRTGVSRAMVKKVLGSLQATLDEAISRGLLVANVARGIKVVSQSRHDDEDDRCWVPERDVVRKLLDHARAWRTAPPRIVRNGKTTAGFRITPERAAWFYAILMTLVGDGLRISEALGLEDRGIDRQHRMLTVRQRVDAYGKIGPTKSAAGRRTIETPSEVIAAIDYWLTVRPKAGEAGLLLPNGAGNPERYRNLHRRFWTPLMIEIGQTAVVVGEDGVKRLDANFGIHALRHFHASLCVSRGMNVKDLQERMGHSSIKMTLDVYGHLFADEEGRDRRRKAVEAATQGLFAFDAPQVEAPV